MIRLAGHAPPSLVRYDVVTVGFFAVARHAGIPGMTSPERALHWRRETLPPLPATLTRENRWRIWWWNGEPRSER